MRGRRAVSEELLSSTENPVALLTAPNRDGCTPLHLMLKAGPSDDAQEAVLGALKQLEVRMLATS